VKDFFIEHCAAHENQTITTSFVVAGKQVKPKKNGEPYLALTFADRTGHIEAKMWDGVPEAMDTFEQDDFVKVRGLLNKYNGRFQLTVHKVRRMEESEIQYADYLPKTTKDVDQLWSTVAQFVDGFKNPHLKALLQAFIADPEIERAYKNAPAAKTLHHAFIGGLLDHVVSLLTLCDLVSRNYPQVDRDLVMTGAFLHDIGKIHELSYARSFTYTTQGQLLGHMIIELEMLHHKLAAMPEFPPELKILLEHMIISHHGHYEFGSPKLPMFPEALLLHYLDDLDSKMESMRAHFQREESMDSDWTSYNVSLGRTLLNTPKFIARAEAQRAKSETEGSASGLASLVTDAGEKSEPTPLATEDSIERLRDKFAPKGKIDTKPREVKADAVAASNSKTEGHF
jgi:3'-5' exoribonuclease